MRLLIIEDDRDATDYLVKAFREVGHVADKASDGEEGQALALEGQYDVLIVDRMLPKLDGLSIVAALRAKSIETPVLILSALGQVDDRVKGLRTGGDDYLSKPYAFSELLARVEALGRRRGNRGEETVYRGGDLELRSEGPAHRRRRLFVQALRILGAAGARRSTGPPPRQPRRGDRLSGRRSRAPI